VCNPNQLDDASPTDNPNTCDVGGTSAGANKALVAGANNTSSVFSDLVTANIAGTWCFRAQYTHSGTIYEDSSDAGTNECFQVGKVNTNTVTTPSGSSPHAVNDQVTDHAVVTAVTAGDGFPSGTIDFFICSPSQLDDPANATDDTTTCDSGGTPAGSKTATEVSGASPPASEATSNAVTANVVGTWCFRAVYTPGAPNG